MFITMLHYSFRVPAAGAVILKNSSTAFDSNQRGLTEFKMVPVSKTDYSEKSDDLRVVGVSYSESLFHLSLVPVPKKMPEIKN
jgi:hypothetical protein